jgi:hypothetical protein
MVTYKSYLSNRQVFLVFFIISELLSWNLSALALNLLPCMWLTSYLGQEI